MQVTLYRSHDYSVYYIKEPAIKTAAMLATIGGILNFWMGISLVVLFEIIELMSDLMRISVHKLTKRLSAVDANSTHSTRTEKVTRF